MLSHEERINKAYHERMMRRPSYRRNYKAVVEVKPDIIPKQITEEGAFKIKKKVNLYETMDNQELVNELFNEFPSFSDVRKIIKQYIENNNDLSDDEL